MDLRRNAPLNQYPGWVYFIIGIVAVIAIIYALPNFFGESPSLQLSPKNGDSVKTSMVKKVKKTLKNANIPYEQIQKKDKYVIQARFNGVSDQLKAKSVLKEKMGDRLTSALTLASQTPTWLKSLGAEPMNLGLDLRGGMYFVLEANLDQAIKHHLDNYAQELRQQYRQQNIRYSGISVKNNRLIVDLSNRSSEVKAKALNIINNDYQTLKVADESTNQISLRIEQSSLVEFKNNAVSQVIQVMRNRVNELGVAEASVARAGSNRVIIELPGIQDAARAKQILGGTATVNFQLVNEKVNAQTAQSSDLPIGSSLYHTKEGRPVVLHDEVILSGDSVVDAYLGYDQQTSLPAVIVKLSGPDVSYFAKKTKENVGHKMATVMVKTDFQTSMVNGKEVTVPKTTKKVISVAQIQSQLGNRFQITGLNQREAQKLAVLIRSGSLPTPVRVVQEQLIGPTLGADNIRKGAISIIVALTLVMLFMLVYYRLFGLIANVALIFNLLLIIGIMSIIPGATLTLPGIAGIVLNLGMAIDANVLIFERIREELRNNISPHAAIHSGYNRAFATIIDANLTTLIVAIILFAIGTGAVKGFSVTLMIGITTSVFTSIVVSRAITNLIYGKRRNLSKVSIGI
jgi:preprotein translocase subunit SecD